jgi:RNA polymerase sigma-70 factor (ECF subfamily)
MENNSKPKVNFSESGDNHSLDETFPAIYAELRRLAKIYLRREGADHTLNPTALVHEAYLRLRGQRNVDWQNREQFLGVAAQMMRRILVNHAEAKQALKRGGRQFKESLDAVTIFCDEQNLDLLALNQALKKLAEIDEQKSRIVELKFFGGLTANEIARVIGKSTATVERDWTFARAWLLKQMQT